MNYLPKARVENIVTQDIDGELLIYDLSVNKALCLNETAKTVWQACDGKTTFDDFRRKSNPDFSDELIWLTLEKLKQDSLFDKNEGITPNFNGLSRREVVKKIGFTSMIAMPIIASIVAPSAIHAQSGATCEGPCVLDGDIVECTFGNIGSQACVDNLTNRCCIMMAVSGSCACNNGICSGSITCASCILSGQTSSGSFGDIGSQTCVDNLIAACCLLMASAGSCACNNGTCSGSVTCS